MLCTSALDVCILHVVSVFSHSHTIAIINIILSTIIFSPAPEGVSHIDSESTTDASVSTSRTDESSITSQLTPAQIMQYPYFQGISPGLALNSAHSAHVNSIPASPFSSYGMPYIMQMMQGRCGTPTGENMSPMKASSLGSAVFGVGETGGGSSISTTKDTKVNKNITAGSRRGSRQLKSSLPQKGTQHCHNKNTITNRKTSTSCTTHATSTTAAGSDKRSWGQKAVDSSPAGVQNADINMHSFPPSPGGSGGSPPPLYQRSTK